MLGMGVDEDRVHGRAHAVLVAEAKQLAKALA